MYAKAELNSSCWSLAYISARICTVPYVDLEPWFLRGKRENNHIPFTGE